ncbi:MAG: glycosyltransferase family 4 protein, partial [Oscillochloris sp.]|nr:glycosyltransferase family 4 protein [Oscillochloris sp.]
HSHCLLVDDRAADERRARRRPHARLEDADLRGLPSTVSTEETEELTSAMAQVLDDETLRAEMSRRGLEQAARFSWERAARETLAIYRRVGGQ